MTIGEAASRSGLSTQAIRYYEREGLLPAPRRSHTGYRIYEPQVLGRLNFIRTARSLGLSLAEIKEIFRMSKSGQAPCCRVRELLSDKLTELDRQIVRLNRFREELRRFLKTLAQVPDQADTSQYICGLIEMAPGVLPSAPPAKDVGP